MSTMTVYGTDWCPDVRRARHLLDGRGVDYEFINIDEDSAAEKQVLTWNDGRRRVPTIVVSHEGRDEVLSNPRRDELSKAIDEMAVGEGSLA